MTDLSRIESIDKASDRDLLLMILSTQVQIARRLEFLESHMKSEKFGSVDELSDDIANNLNTFASHLAKAIKRRHS
jgi:hypothetical protein